MMSSALWQFGFLVGNAAEKRASLTRAVHILTRKAGGRSLVKTAQGRSALAAVLGPKAGPTKVVKYVGPIAQKGLRAFLGRHPVLPAAALAAALTGAVAYGTRRPKPKPTPKPKPKPKPKPTPVFTPEEVRQSLRWTGVSPEQMYGQWRAMLGTQRRLQRLAELSKGYSQAFRM